MSIKVCEASEIGLPPGYWPSKITTPRFMLVRHTVVRNNEGEMQYVDYWNDSTGDIIRVFND